MSNKAFLSICDIHAGYGKKEILHGINFVVEPHTLTALVVANGCGKSTLMKCIANQLSYKGECVLLHEKLSQMSLKKLARKVSYMPQKSSLSIAISVLDVVLMGFNPVLKLMERPSQAHKELALEALRKVGLNGFENRDYQTLSEGEKQLVILARIFVEDTKILLLDEPDSALDFQNRYRVIKKIRQMILGKEKAGIICIHDPALALEFCDQLILIKDGSHIATIEPQNHSIAMMEKALQHIYGNVTIAECIDKKGQRHLKLLWEDEE